MRKRLVVTSSPIPLDALKLGSLVTDINHPQLDAHALLKPSSDEISSAQQKAYKSLVHNYKSTTLKPHLAVFGFEYTQNTDDSLILEATMGSLYELTNPTAWFEKLCEDSLTQVWLQKMTAARKDIFLVTGCRALFDARITVKQSSSRTRGAEIDVPVDTILAAATAGLPISTGLDVGLEGKRSESNTISEESSAPGEQIYAVQYRRVKLGFFSSRRVDSDALKAKIVWKDVFTQRGPGEENDMVEAEIVAALRIGKAFELVGDDNDDAEYMIIGTQQ